MSRKTRSEIDEDEAPPADVAPAADDTDVHGFWDRAKLDGVENDEAFSIVIDEDDAEHLSDAETLVYMGSVTQVDPDELVRLADWAESKACPACRHRLRDADDPQVLLHEECRTALRVTRLLRRYH